VQFNPAMHRVPQAPQFSLSVCNAEQVPAQFTVPDGQVHAPPLHTRLLPQICEQIPQLVLSVRRSAQELPHWVYPGAVHRTAQVPALHTGVLGGHRLPHAPQFALLH
jgi:hypothetical protein